MNQNKQPAKKYGARFLNALHIASITVERNGKLVVPDDYTERQTRQNNSEDISLKHDDTSPAKNV